jgi:hypothetical protein
VTGKNTSTALALIERRLTPKDEHNRTIRNKKILCEPCLGKEKRPVYRYPDAFAAIFAIVAALFADAVPVALP